MTVQWEDMVSLHSDKLLTKDSLGPAEQYRSMDLAGLDRYLKRYPLETALKADPAPLPTTEQREGYYGPNHYAYWVSGLNDLEQIQDWMDAKGKKIESLLEIGCATGRFLRHAHFQARIPEVMGCDINRLHVDWISYFLPKPIRAFQNTSMPTLPLASASLDFIAAFSVFTHIESFDTTWLMEFRRVLRPGGVAWITIHGDRTWTDLDETWPIYKAIMTHPNMTDRSVQKDIPSDRFTLRWDSGKSYSANIYYKYAYIHSVWGRFFDVADILVARPLYQDVVVLVRN